MVVVLAEMFGKELEIMKGNLMQWGRRLRWEQRNKRKKERTSNE